METGHSGEVFEESNHICLYVPVITPTVRNQGEVGEKRKGIVERAQVHIPMRQIQSELCDVLVDTGENTEEQPLYLSIQRLRPSVPITR